MIRCVECGRIRFVWQESGTANEHMHKRCQEALMRAMLRNATSLTAKKGILSACKILAEAAP